MLTSSLICSKVLAHKSAIRAVSPLTPACAARLARRRDHYLNSQKIVEQQSILYSLADIFLPVLKSIALPSRSVTLPPASSYIKTPPAWSHLVQYVTIVVLLSSSAMLHSHVAFPALVLKDPNAHICLPQSKGSILH